MASAVASLISGRRSSGGQKMVREVKDKLFLLNSARKVMEKGRKQIHFSSNSPKCFQYKLHNSHCPQHCFESLLMPPPDITQAVIQPSMWRSASGKGRCVSVCAFLLLLCMTRTWLQSSRASGLHSSRTSQPSLALQCHTWQFSALLHVCTRFKRFWRLSLYHTFSW